MFTGRRACVWVCVGPVGVWVQLTQSGPASLASVENNSFQDFSVKVREPWLGLGLGLRLGLG